MSHFACVVILPKNSPTDPESQDKIIEEMLAPFDENIEVPPYKEECFCVGAVARSAAYDACVREFGSIDVARTAYWRQFPYGNPEHWQKNIAGPREAFEKAFIANREDAKAPRPNCEECGGTGQRETTYNPKSQWDWYQTGGRWTGFFSGNDPKDNSNNIEKCDLCAGTGKRTDMQVAHGCNGCMGKGTRVKWPTEFEEEGARSTCARALQMIAEAQGDNDRKPIPFAFLTPDGEWIERGKMGWWGMVSGETDKDVWDAQALSIYERFKDHACVQMDLHI